MYVVKRSFKNLGKVHTPGSVIADPSCIKRFKGKLAEGKIVNVTEQTYDAMAGYFKDKFGVDIPKLTESTKSEEKPVAAEEKPVAAEEKPVAAEPKQTIKKVVVNTTAK